MNQRDQKSVPATYLLRRIVCNILSILLFPVTLAGYVIWVGGAVLAGRGISPFGQLWTPLQDR